jgi:hypothetical protein
MVGATLMSPPTARATAGRTPIQTGDLVELISVPAGRPRIRVGQRGRVLLGEDAGLAWHLVTVAFRTETRPHLVAARHVRRVAAAEGS